MGFFGEVGQGRVIKNTGVVSAMVIGCGSVGGWVGGENSVTVSNSPITTIM